MADICVVHLVRAKNGIEPFSNFLESYLRYDGGIDHDLLIVFKGFSGENSTVEYSKLLKRISYKALYMDDFGFDISAYFFAAKTITMTYYCFLNSFSTILDNKWLFKLYSQMIKQNIGIVGATGSLESQYTNFIIAHQQNELSHGNLLHRLNVYVEQIKFKHYFDPFPNYHLRTNGFMISRNIISKIHFRPLHDKMDAHRFESGKNSLTKQILQMGLDILVVGKNGQGYHKDEWCRSGTFRQGEQINLLIADNQTNTYLHADPELREMLSHLAWGD